jgi:prophage antirepressor-like protein
MAYEPERFEARPEGAYAMNINEFIKEVFRFEDKKVKIVGTYEEPWFCARDVCGILEYKKYRDALYDHVDEEDKKNLYEIMNGYVVGATPTTPELNNETKACYITEAGLYDLVMHSRLPNAKRFKKWITKEVLPALRKTGEYKVQPSQDVDELTKYFEEQLRLKDTELQEKNTQNNKNTYLSSKTSPSQTTNATAQRSST